VFPHPIAFNLFSHNTAIGENGYNEEENKVVQESRKILHDPDIRISPTCIRVPVLRAHAESILAEFEQKITVEQARDLLAKAPGVRLVDEPARNHFPMPIEASGKDEVLVGRIREDLSSENGLCLFVAADQLLKGAALNAVQIAEAICR
jgi:aspartate-semialdehyde dehydrogenase